VQLGGEALKEEFGFTVRQIAQSKRDYDAGRVRNARDPLTELKSARATTAKRGIKTPAKTA
jgi:hypothetical protein